jgi:hypothetical protein
MSEETNYSCYMTLILTHFRKSTEEKMQDSPFSLQEMKENLARKTASSSRNTV